MHFFIDEKRKIVIYLGMDIVLDQLLNLFDVLQRLVPEIFIVELRIVPTTCH